MDSFLRNRNGVLALDNPFEEDSNKSILFNYLSECTLFQVGGSMVCATVVEFVVMEAVLATCSIRANIEGLCLDAEGYRLGDCIKRANIKGLWNGEGYELDNPYSDFYGWSQIEDEQSCGRFMPGRVAVGYNNFYTKDCKTVELQKGNWVCPACIECIEARY